MSADELQQVQAAVQSHLSRPTSLGLNEAPVTSLPKGKTVYYIYNSAPVTAATAVSARQAAQTLGWTINVLPVPSTPLGYQQAFAVALRDPSTSAIVAAALSVSTISAQLQQAGAKHIPVAIIQPDSNSGTDYTAIGGPPSYTSVGKLEADYMLARTQGQSPVLLAITDAVPSLKILATSFTSEWTTRCPKCQAPLTYDASAESFGRNFPALLTAYLEAHRSVKNVVFGFGDMMIGVPTALQAAGLSDVKAETWAQGPEINSLIGNFAVATVANPVLEFPWVAFDAVVRTFEHQSTAQDSAFTGPTSSLVWFITKSGMQQAGLDPNKTWPMDANYVQEFKKLWGLTK